MMSKNDNAPLDTTKEYIREIFYTAKEKKEDVKDDEKNAAIDEIKKKWDMNDKILKLFAENIEQDQKLRSKYAIILIRILSVELVALITIFILKGAGVLNYSDSTFNIFISGGIAEIFVLVRVIVKYLFKDNLTNALNTILENNNKIRQTKNKNYRNIKKD